jgi:hypothetical protein
VGVKSFRKKTAVRIQRGGSQTPYLFREFGNGADIFLSLSRRNPHQAQTILQPHEPHKFLKKGDPLDGHVITIQVMAIPDVSPSHHDPVCSALKSPQHVVRRDRSRAHDPDGPEVDRVLKAAHPCQIRRTIRAPVAEKGEDSGFKTILCHLPSPAWTFPSALPFCVLALSLFGNRDLMPAHPCSSFDTSGRTLLPIMVRYRTMISSPARLLARAAVMVHGQPPYTGYDGRFQQPAKPKHF